ncbi:hypothetical protein NL676_011754 [Syzygium grande]|nr:hypothetical protein NL676_011754 [Syzygium grande]
MTGHQSYTTPPVVGLRGESGMSDVGLLSRHARTKTMGGACGVAATSTPRGGAPPRDVIGEVQRSTICKNFSFSFSFSPSASASTDSLFIIILDI